MKKIIILLSFLIFSIKCAPIIIDYDFTEINQKKVSTIYDYSDNYGKISLGIN
jgi:hypothetical protein